MERGVTSAAAVPPGTSARSIRMHLAVLAKAGACGAEGGAPAAEPPSSSDGAASNGELMMSVLGSMAAGVTARCQRAARRRWLIRHAASA